MSRSKVHRDPIAITSSGDVLVNAAQFDDLRTLEEALERAKAEEGEVFIGFVVRAEETSLLSRRVHDACREGAAFIVGKRQRRLRRRR